MRAISDQSRGRQDGKFRASRHPSPELSVTRHAIASTALDHLARRALFLGAGRSPSRNQRLTAKSLQARPGTKLQIISASRVASWSSALIFARHVRKEGSTAV